MKKAPHCLRGFEAEIAGIDRRWGRRSMPARRPLRRTGVVQANTRRSADMRFAVRAKRREGYVVKEFGASLFE